MTSANDGISVSEFEQSTRNFLRLFESIAQQSKMDRCSVLESAMQAVLASMVSDIGPDATARLMIEIANRLIAQTDNTNVH